jgi:RNA polymerase sigma factor (sigma-70 family)
MAQVINTNSLSLITQNNINKNQSALSSSIERLSSGLRINSAKDDAAGQAIANRFTSNIKGLTQAARNANDGISVAQTTEGALSEINNNLQRIRELTVQATTGTNSTSDLDSIQDEIKSRLDEIDRVSGQTQFNGVNVLSKDGSMKIQVGANDGETITIDLKKIDSDTLGLNGFNVNGKGETANTAATLKDMSGFTAAAAPGGTVGVTQYTDKSAVASSVDILNAVAGTDGNKVTTSADVGFGTPAAAVTYTYNKHSLWQRYVPLVRHEALRLQVRLPASVELDDLLQAGGIGLLNAVERYDALQGTAFTTYAVQRIRGAMLDELRSRDWVPRSVRRNAREVAQAIGQLEQELGRNATEPEVAERLGIDIADYRQMLLDTNNSQLFSYDE